MRTSTQIVLGVALSAGLALAQPATSIQKIDVNKLGPQVGQTVPTFSLQDQNGKVRDLASIMGPKGAMLVFVRSADW